MATRSDGRAGVRSEAWFLVASLGPVALGVLIAVGLLQIRLTPDREPIGLLQGIIVGIHRGVGFVAGFYACLLMVLWGAVAFVSGAWRGPLRRMLATLALCLSLSLLTAALGGDGGSLGAGAAGRFLGALGTVPTVGLFGVMTLAALLLATDWFFFRSFVRMASRPPDVGLAPEEEAVLAGERPTGETAVGEAPPVGVPEPVVRERRRRRTEGDVQPAEDRGREQERVDRAVAEARGAPAPDFGAPTLDISAAEILQARPDAAADPFADLDDEALLAQAGAQMDKLWSQDESTSLVPAPPEPGESARPDVFAVVGDLPSGEPRAEEPLAAASSAGQAALSPAAPEATVDLPASELLPQEPDVVLEPVPPRRERSAVPIDEDADDGAGRLVQEELFADEPPDPALLDQAAEIVLTARRPMPSLLQRQLKLSFAQARQTMAYLERLGVVGAPEGAGPWLPLIDLDEWRRRSGTV